MRTRGGLLGVIGGAQQHLAVLQGVVDLPAAEAVITPGDDVHAAVQQVPAGGRRDAVAVGGVLPVGDDQIHGLEPFDAGQPFPQEGAPHGAHHIADTEYMQHTHSLFIRCDF